MLRRQNEIASQEDNQNVRQENGRLRLESKELLETGRVPKQEKSPGRKDYPGKIRIPRQVAGSYVIATGSHDSRGRAVTLIKPIKRRETSLPKSSAACASSDGVCRNHLRYGSHGQIVRGRRIHNEASIHASSVADFQSESSRRELMEGANGRAEKKALLVQRAIANN